MYIYIYSYIYIYIYIIRVYKYMYINNYKYMYIYIYIFIGNGCFFGGIVPPPNQQDLAMADHLPTWAPSKSIDSFPNGLVGKKIWLKIHCFPKKNPSWKPYWMGKSWKIYGFRFGENPKPKEQNPLISPSAKSMPKWPCWFPNHPMIFSMKCRILGGFPVPSLIIIPVFPSTSP